MNMQNCNKVLDYLYVGNRGAPEMHEYKFSLIVNCTKDIKFIGKCNNYIRVPVNDLPEDYFKLFNIILETQVIDKIHESINKKETVLIHCQGGIQRSCAVAVCYLIKYNNMTQDDAIKYLKQCRPVAFFGQINFKDTIRMFTDHINKIKLLQ